MNGTGFLTVVGIGLSGDVQLIKEESEKRLLQWQDMLYNQYMLLFILGTSDPYSADKAGTTPNRKDGSVFSWKISGDEKLFPKIILKIK